MRVLLVEDDYAVSQSIETMLKKEGMIVDTTDLGEDGLEIGKLYDYDIIILDLMLPDMNGYEVLKSLRAAKVNTPVLILSGLSEPDKKVKGLGYGADDYRAPEQGRAAGPSASRRSPFQRSFQFNYPYRRRRSQP